MADGVPVVWYGLPTPVPTVSDLSDLLAIYDITPLGSLNIDSEVGCVSFIALEAQLPPTAPVCMGVEVRSSIQKRKLVLSLRPFSLFNLN